MKGMVSDSALVVESPNLLPQSRCSVEKTLLLEPVGNSKDAEFSTSSAVKVFTNPLQDKLRWRWGDWMLLLLLCHG